MKTQLFVCFAMIFIVVESNVIPIRRTGLFGGVGGGISANIGAGLFGGLGDAGGGVVPVAGGLAYPAVSPYGRYVPGYMPPIQGYIQPGGIYG